MAHTKRTIKGFLSLQQSVLWLVAWALIVPGCPQLCAQTAQTLMALPGDGIDPTTPAGAYITLPSTPSLSVKPGTTVNFSGATDTGTTLTWTFGDGGTASGAAASHAYATAGTYTATFRAAASGYTTSSATVTVNVGNPPTVSSFAASTTYVVEGGSVTFTWSASGATSYTLNPGNLTTTGTTLTMIPSATATYVLTATNPYGSASSTGLGVTLNHKPVFAASLGSRSLPADTPCSVTLPSATDADSVDAGKVTYAASGLPPGLTFDATTRILSGQPTTTGTFTVTETATDPRGAIASQSATFTVTVPAVPVITSFTGPSLINLGSAGGLNWGITGGIRSVSISPTVGDVTGQTGASVSPTITTTYTLTVTNLGGTVTRTFKLVVNQPPVVPAVAAQSGLKENVWFGLNLPDATDPEGDAITYSVSEVAPGLGFNAATQFLDGIPTTAGAYTLVYTARDTKGAATSVTVAITVAPNGNAAPPPTTLPDLSLLRNAKFEENLSYTGSDTGLITAVDVNRQLSASMAALASGNDTATTSHYEYGYDSLGQLISSNGTYYTDPTKAVQVFTDLTSYGQGDGYDAHGNRLKHTTAKGVAWTYTYQAGTNRLVSAGDFGTFEYTADGAVKRVVKGGKEQTFYYGDPRHMRLPTRMVRATGDGRLVETDVAYDMSGTRIWKRDLVRQNAGSALSAGADGSISGTVGSDQLQEDRETTYLANGTEVLMEVENRGVSSSAKASDRTTAYIFGAGSRLARLSWDADQRESLAYPTNVPLTNPWFEEGTRGWTGVGTTPTTALKAGSTTDDILVVPQGTVGSASYAESSLGSFKAGEVVKVSVPVQNESGAGAAVALLDAANTDTAHGGATCARVWHQEGTNCSISRDLAAFAAGDTVTATVWFKAATGLTGRIYVGPGSGNPYVMKELAGNGAWQQIAVTLSVTTATTLKVYLYGSNNNSMATMYDANRAGVLYDDLVITSTVKGAVLMEGFEGGVAAFANSWSPSGQATDLVSAAGSLQVLKAPATSWATYTLQRVLPKAGTVKVQLHTISLAENLKSQFSYVQATRYPAASLGDGLPNLWPDPGFEGPADPDANVATAGVVTTDCEGSNREGLHVLRVAANSSYTRTCRNLRNGYTYLFSVWFKADGTSIWTRQTQTLTASGYAATVTLNQAGAYDQAELVPWTTGTSLPEAWIPENRLGRVDWFITDHLGSTKLLIDQNGQHRFTGDDDPFGINLRSFGDKDSHRYTGQILDEEQGAYYYGARYYLPEIGRFLSGDPKREFNNIYMYVGNHPTVSTDPSGESEAPASVVNGVGYYNAPNGGFNAMNLADMSSMGWVSALPVVKPRLPSDGAIKDDSALLLSIAMLGRDIAKLGPALLEGGYKYVAGKLAERRTAKVMDLMEKGVGVNITPISSIVKYETIGNGGRTFVTEIGAVENIIGNIGEKRIVTISSQQARALEGALGLPAGRLESDNILSIVSNLSGRSPASPLSGNSLFLGAGRGLPSGAAELTINGVASRGTSVGVTSVLLRVK